MKPGEAHKASREIRGYGAPTFVAVQASINDMCDVLHEFPRSLPETTEGESLQLLHSS